VKFARAKGVRPQRIVRRHILRNILIPVITVLGIEFGALIAFSTITETSSPGRHGKLLITSIYRLDRRRGCLRHADHLPVRPDQPDRRPHLRRAGSARETDGSGVMSQERPFDPTLVPPLVKRRSAASTCGGSSGDPT
jgi:hypothetical protein